MVTTPVPKNFRLFNHEEFLYDLNESANGYAVEQAHPNIYAWLVRESLKQMKLMHPGRFRPVRTVPSIVDGLKPSLKVDGLTHHRLYAKSDFDCSDADRGLLWYYESEVFRGRKNLDFASLQLLPIVYWMAETQPTPDHNWMPVTYEVARKKQVEYEKEKAAKALLAAERLRKHIAEVQKALDQGLTTVGLMSDIVFDLKGTPYQFKVFVSESDYLEEGNAQRNCMHWRMYERFKENKTFCGGIRKKADPGTPFISIELGTSALHIYQAEYAGNRSAIDDPAVTNLNQWLDANGPSVKEIRSKLFELNTLIANATSELSALRGKQPGSGDLEFTVRV